MLKYYLWDHYSDNSYRHLYFTNPYLARGLLGNPKYDSAESVVVVDFIDVNTFIYVIPINYIHD